MKPAEFFLLSASSHSFLAWLILWHWRWRQHIPPKCRLTFSRLHIITLHNHCWHLKFYTEILEFS
jgi:hypothetical protein